MSINFRIRAKDLDLTPEITNYIHEKLGVVEKFLNINAQSEILAEVEVVLRSRHHKKGDVYRAEINLSHNGRTYRAVTRAGDVFSALDELKDEISTEIKHLKDKKDSLLRRGARRIKYLLKR